MEKTKETEVKTYKAWAIRMGSGKFLCTPAGHVILLETREIAREEVAHCKSAFKDAKDLRVARVEVEIREIY